MCIFSAYNLPNYQMEVKNVIVPNNVIIYINKINFLLYVQSFI